MEAQNVILARRSIRDFLQKPIEAEKIQRILRAGMEAPSAHNRRPWEFIVFTDDEQRNAVAEMSPWAKMLTKAAAGIAVCANLELGESKEGSEDTYWVQDCSAATENILLQAAQEKLGGVWLGWYPDSNRVKRFSDYFKLPKHIVPLSVIALGYPAKDAEPANRYDEKLVHFGKW
ncbi:MAG: nitroreductase family protein [Termitinemataceae bacterium]|nr:MAG: nitroreductase family protein [Termitinemataceae bacterium]